MHDPNGTWISGKPELTELVPNVFGGLVVYSDQLDKIGHCVYARECLEKNFFSIYIEGPRTYQVYGDFFPRCYTQVTHGEQTITLANQFITLTVLKFKSFNPIAKLRMVITLFQRFVETRLSRMAHDLVEPADGWLNHSLWQCYSPLRVRIMMIFNVTENVCDIVVKTFVNVSRRKLLM